MRFRSTRNVAAAVCLLLVMPSAGLAQEDGVTIDPDSPAGKEYSIPLDSARERTAPERSGAPSAPSGTPDGADGSEPGDRRFGEGIDGEGDGEGDDSRDGDRSERSTPGGGDETPRTRTTPEAAAPADAAPATEGDEDDGGSPAGLIAGGLLAAGLLGGGALRLRGRRA